MSGDVVARVKDALAVCICVGDNDDPEMLIRLNDVSELVAILESVDALATRWENATNLTDGQPNIVARAFADDLRRALGASE
ncbi:hypothetical protein [Mycolicibacterium llatzerense]|uniref:hypothetical protein n=1 Tax=Mycolicibacterium llatzerense TaxID=280871 RepID=UPI0021B542C6|nr:hypothetical protein [Mycolicibacterium llatzerense]MCT7361197.1 hypothetical protein [Mycolicibacterium llatzerense]